MNQKSNVLKQAIGPISLAAIVFNCTVGGGIFRLPGEVYEIAGAYAPLAYIICALTTVFITIVFIKVGNSNSESGGPYAYVEKELGGLSGFITGFLLLLLGIFAMASVANALVEAVFVLFPSFASIGAKTLIIVTVFTILGLSNVKGVKTGANVVSIITFFKLLPLLILIGYGLTKLGGVYLENTITPSSPLTAVIRAALVLMFAFMGIESALTPSEEIKNPQHTLKKGLFIGMTAILLVYMCLQIVSQNILGPEIVALKHAPLAFAAERIMGPLGKTLLLVATVLSMFGYLSSMSLGIPRILYKMGKDKIFPEFLGYINPKTQTPNAAIFTLLLIVTVFSLTGTFSKLVIIANLSAISMYILCSIAAIKKDPKKPIIPLLTIVMLSTLLSSLNFSEYIGVALASIVAASIFMVRKKTYQMYQFKNSKI
ncbi:APC family permease [bacterium]|nr:APC family permease [bacterium]